MKLLHFFAIIFAVSAAWVGSERRRPPPHKGPPGGGPPPHKNGPPSANGTTSGGNGTAPGGNGTRPILAVGTTIMNITSNGVDYFNVRYINETTMERVELVLGSITIPAGCYPCIGAYWCASILRPSRCRSDPECDFNDEVTGCEDMLSSTAVRLATCEECHANGSNYCIVQNICVEEEVSDNCIDHLITTDTALAALGTPTDCQILENTTENAMEAGTEETKHLRIISILLCASGVLLFFVGCCIVYDRRKDRHHHMSKRFLKSTSFDLGEEDVSTEENAALPSAFNISTKYGPRA